MQCPALYRSYSYPPTYTQFRYLMYSNHTESKYFSCPALYIVKQYSRQQLLTKPYWTTRTALQSSSATVGRGRLAPDPPVINKTRTVPAEIGHANHLPYVDDQRLERITNTPANNARNRPARNNVAASGLLYIILANNTASVFRGNIVTIIRNLQSFPSPQWPRTECFCIMSRSISTFK